MFSPSLEEVKEIAKNKEKKDSYKTKYCIWIHFIIKQLPKILLEQYFLNLNPIIS